MAKKNSNFISARESRRISRENAKITRKLDKQLSRKHVPETEYLTTMHDDGNVVEFDDLHTCFFTDVGTVKAVDGVSFNIPVGKTVGVVGESGCGKSVTSLSLMQLLQRPTGQIVSGEIRLNLGDKAYDVTKMPIRAMEKIRGNVVSMIFQEPMTSLNPVFKIGFQLDEIIKLHNPELSDEEVKNRSVEAIKMVGIPDAEGIYMRYPHELSGGMRQRIVIAMALVCNPRLIIADEPTTALDVTIQAQILELMKELQKEENTSIIFITHNLGVVAEICDRVSVMYAGKIIEQGKVNDIFYHPQHPYTKGLLASMPRLDEDGHERLIPIEGTPIDLLNPPKGCNFAPRCSECRKICLRAKPSFSDMGDGHISACWLHTMGQQDAEKEEPEA